MSLITLALLTFLVAYMVNAFYITVFYHRGLTHRAVTLTPFAMRLVDRTGNWVTGIDPKAWACMHRLHHLHSDGPDDPHSPVHQGVLGVALGQLRSYRRALTKLIVKNASYDHVVADIPFDVNVLNRKQLWYLPYLLHVLLAFAIGALSGSAWVGAAYYLGIMSHPVQGWMVNSLGHRYGYQTYPRGDNSRNNLLVALAVFGEGLQNNHHEAPESARFAHRWYEPDIGFFLCRLGAALGLLTIRPADLRTSSTA